MAVELRSPFSWQTVGGDTATMLAELQPNILKGHARDYLTLLFLRFDQAVAARAFVRGLAVSTPGRPLMKSARTHLEEIAAFKANGTPGTPYVGLGLTAAAYAALGIPATKRPSDPSFQRGMQHAPLGDPPRVHVGAALARRASCRRPRWRRDQGLPGPRPGKGPSPGSPEPACRDPGRGVRSRDAQRERGMHRALRLRRWAQSAALPQRRPRRRDRSHRWRDGLEPGLWGRPGDRA